MAGFVKELLKYQVSFFPAVNTLYNGLLQHAGFDKLDFSKLKISNGGGMATQKPVAEKWLKTTGCACRRLWPVRDLADADLQPRRHRAVLGHDRLPVPSTYLSIRDDDGNEVPLGRARRNLRQGSRR
jgi:long-chain acyl-CoA synthetase